MISDCATPVLSRGDILAGRYRLLEPLAEGGMGSVWSARSLGLNVDVALKVVKRGTSSPKACERLLREAHAAASLAHPSIVRVLDFGTTALGESFLVMQLLRGETLAARLRERGRLPATAAVQLMLPIVSALAEAHACGIVHRDIKPENIIVEQGPSGHLVPKLVDFGIAKQNNTEQSVFTQSGVLLGSPAYMSPEQARGDTNLDARSDIWSLSVVLYELITGDRPFEGVHSGGVLFSVFADEPEPFYARGAGDVGLWNIVHRGLSKKPADRFQGMNELGRALAEWAFERGVTVDATGASLSHHWLSQDQSPQPASGGGMMASTMDICSSEVEVIHRRGRSRSAMLRLSGALLVVSGILTFLLLSPLTKVPSSSGVAGSTGGSISAGEASAGQSTRVEVPSKVTVFPVLAAASAPLPSAIPQVVASAPSRIGGSAPGVDPTGGLAKAKGPPPSAQKAPVPRVVQRRAAANRGAMPLPSTPDF